jgi:phosphonate transport system substrate-binding protein
VKLSRRLFFISLFLASCGNRSKVLQDVQFTIGMVSYEEGQTAFEQFDEFKEYFAEQTRSFLLLEPTFNENKALERIQSQAWSLVFAPPGLAAIAISQYSYTPLLPLEGINNLRSIIVVKSNSPYQDLRSLTNTIIALGQKGSATGYYLPIFNFYGLTLAEISFLPTPKAVLKAVAEDRAAAGALSLDEFYRYKQSIDDTEFRILFTDPHNIPSGGILIGPHVEEERKQEILRILQETPSQIANSAGFVPKGSIPDYQYMISVVERVKSIFPTVDTMQKPVRLFNSLGRSPNSRTRHQPSAIT